MPKTSPPRSLQRPAAQAPMSSVAAAVMPTQMALDESELAARWRIAPRTLRRWRQERIGPIFKKIGSRVTYLLTDVQAYERRVSRHSTSASVRSEEYAHG